jgi:adenosyl cobinamide kinase/adenosyl cobinamide phosphate guanylyltransferase
MLTLLLGGARSGKSALALELAAAGTATVVFLATGGASDEEMARRIALHRSQRPASWGTVEEPVEIERAFRAVPDGATVVLDCLTLRVSNLLAAGYEDDATVAMAGAVASLGAGREGKVIVVSNEVGSGIVPTDNSLSRRYRDLLGRVNMVFAEHAQEAFLVVAGRVLPLVPMNTVRTKPVPLSTGAQ